MAQYNYSPKYALENYSYVFPFEDTFNPVESTSWMQRNWTLSITFSILYVLAIYAGQRFMESRKPFLLNGALFYWNLGLAIFSFMGFFRMSPEMYWSVNSNSFKYSICTASYAQGVTGFWTEQFAMSKLIEFFDTAFIVLRKRTLIFLHWYHHVTVLVYTWHAYKDHTSSGRWFIWMNYGVHSFMYSYYALTSLKIRVPKFCAMFITVIQILQMIMGVYIGITVYQIKAAGKPCQQTTENLYFSFCIYGSYALLFLNFFYQTYIRKGNRYSSEQKSKTDTPKPDGHVVSEQKISGEFGQNGVAKTNGGPVTRRRAQKTE